MLRINEEGVLIFMELDRNVVSSLTKNAMLLLCLYSLATLFHYQLCVKVTLYPPAPGPDLDPDQTTDH